MFWPAEHAAERPALGLLEVVLLNELQVKSSGGVLYSVQPTLFEAHGRCGRCRTAVSQGGSLVMNDMSP